MYFDLIQVPTDQEEMTKWFYTRFVEKEQMLEEFYTTGQISCAQYSKTPIPPQLVRQDAVRFLILHLFFITSTYVHYHFFYAVYEYYAYLLY